MTDEKRILLELTDKEAVAIHMLYFLGSMMIAGDSSYSMSLMASNVALALQENYSQDEKDQIKATMTQLGESIDREVLKSLRIQRRAR